MKTAIQRCTAVSTFVVFSVLLAVFARAAGPAKTGEVVELRPFEVTADADNGYEALSTMGVTGTNRDIRSLPITMDVFTRAMIDDVLATDITEVLAYAANVNYTKDVLGGGRESSEELRIRGIQLKEERRRNGFLSLTKSDTFSTDRIELIRGAQGLLYGQGTASGVVNTVTKRAMFGRDSGSVRLVLDDDGTRRATADYNFGFRDTGVRVALLSGIQRQFQMAVGDHPRGAYVELAQRFFHRRFTLRANHEYIEERASFRDNTWTLRDDSKKDPRNGRRLDDLLLAGDTKGIILGGRELSLENYRSLSGDIQGRRSFQNNTTVQLDGALTPELSARVAWNYAQAPLWNFSNNASRDVYAPTDSHAVNGQWTGRYEPFRGRNHWDTWAAQGALDYHRRTGVLTSDFILGAERRYKRQTYINQRMYAVDATGNPVTGSGNTALYDATGRKFFQVYTAPIQDGFPARNYLPAPGYDWFDNTIIGGTTPTPTNPRGLLSYQSMTIRREEAAAGYVNWIGDWWNRRLQSMAGLRLDRVKLTNDHDYTTVFDGSKPSTSAGLVYNFSEDLGVYGNVSKSFSSAGTFSPSPDNQFFPPGTGVAKEAGVKFDLLNKRISGALAFFQNKGNNESLGIASAQRDAIDPQGINGRHGGNGEVLDVRSTGVELALSAQPVKGWRVQAGVGTNRAIIDSTIVRPIFYNDQFNTDGTTVKIGSSTGSDLLVRQTPGNTSTPLIPLTLAMLKDPTSPYFAKLDATSGRITNASTLGLTTAGVGTGQTGLPIAQHQLGFVAGNNGFFEIYRGGEKTTDGNAGVSGNFNSDYTIQSGLLKNVSLGGALQWRQDVRRGYTQINNVRAIYYDPDSVRVDLRISYVRKFGRYQWQTQFNIRNVLDQYSWVRVLNADGTLNNARTSELPRGFAWTNSIRF